MNVELGIDELRAHALNNIGTARLAKGDRGGLEDIEQSLEVAVAANSPESVRAYGNLASGSGRPRRARARVRDERGRAPRSRTVRSRRRSQVANGRAGLAAVLRRSVGRAPCAGSTSSSPTSRQIHSGWRHPAGGCAGACFWHVEITQARWPMPSAPSSSDERRRIPKSCGRHFPSLLELSSRLTLSEQTVLSPRSSPTGMRRCSPRPAAKASGWPISRR